jgi:hypothetical protein
MAWISPAAWMSGAKGRASPTESTTATGLCFSTPASSEGLRASDHVMNAGQ